MKQDIDLKPFGFSKQESCVYKAGLQLGPAPTSRIARTAHIHRVTTHHILQDMVKKGYASSTKQGNTNYYTMVAPHIIEQILINKTHQFQQLMPDLQQLINTHTNNYQVNNYVGFDGIRTLYNQVLKSTTPLKAFLGVDHMNPQAKQWLYEVYLPQRIEKGIQATSLVSKTKENLFFADPSNVALTNARIIDTPGFDMKSEIILFDHNKILVATLSTGNLSGILIENNFLYYTREQIFDLLWQLYPPQSSKKSA